MQLTNGGHSPPYSWGCGRSSLADLGDLKVCENIVRSSRDDQASAPHTDRTELATCGTRPSHVEASERDCQCAPLMVASRATSTHLSPGRFDSNGGARPLASHSSPLAHFSPREIFPPRPSTSAFSHRGSTARDAGRVDRPCPFPVGHSNCPRAKLAVRDTGGSRARVGAASEWVRAG